MIAQYVPTNTDSMMHNRRDPSTDVEMWPSSGQVPAAAKQRGQQPSLHVRSVQHVHL